MYKICFYSPVESAEAVKNAMFKAGAGKIGNYACCAWQVLGEGQFIPLDGSQAVTGKLHRLEKVKEYKIELVCADECIQDVIVALREAHPYEEPAFQAWRVEEF